MLPGLKQVGCVWFNIQDIVKDVQVHSWRWLRARRKGFTYSLTSWISNPRNVLEKVQYIF